MWLGWSMLPHQTFCSLVHRPHRSGSAHRLSRPNQETVQIHETPFPLHAQKVVGSGHETKVFGCAPFPHQKKKLHLQKMPVHVYPQTLCHYTKQLLEALSYLHSQGIVHNDLRPSLVFLDGGGVKLGGFSIVKR